MGNGFVNPSGDKSPNGNPDNTVFDPNRFLENKSWMNDKLAPGSTLPGVANPSSNHPEPDRDSSFYDYGRPKVDWDSFFKKNPAAIMMVMFIVGLLFTFLLLIIITKFF